MQKIICSLKKAQESIFMYNINEIANSIEILFEELIGVIENIDDSNKKHLDEIIRYINISLSNEDYLLCADILEYELKPFLEENYHSLGGSN